LLPSVSAARRLPPTLGAIYEWTEAKSSAPDFDQARADALVGKHISVGVMILSASGELLERSEYHGIIQSGSPSGNRYLATWRPRGFELGYAAASPTQSRLPNRANIG